MTDLTYDALYTQFTKLYQDQQWAAGLELLTREFEHFPERAADLYYLRFCMAARLEDRPQFFGLLQEALDAGIWYSEPILRESPSLLPWQGDPELEQHIQVHLDYQAQAQTPAPPSATRLPETSPPYPLLLALHGNTGSAKNEVGSWEGVTAGGWMLSMPQSSQMFWAGGGVWNDESLPELEAYYQQLSAVYALDPQRVVLGGFSMGGEIALRAALTSAIPARGFVLFGPGGGPLSAGAEGCEALIQEAQGRGLRGAIIVGQDDASIAQDGIRALAATLNANDIPCKLIIVPSGHFYPPDFDQRLLDALPFVFE
jgi:predicted esterase